ncbi:carboxypeptidase-like regulatory domain-containing protein [Mucilaginibacter robiniae]|uniref:Carboxypeptidase-like regulatory domain-containing protein n=1 Tax=Mucilaginibacter robiniae TaxID=2728022 RepID=A0A7L5E2K7_9SPHI|nr:carboxypeptidase-like regulatory domain-containing protein [Mucilaginibacter robiniae]QJD97522.1 carboxypeptidase-like regulatory domain-containing protein [Mucilaginibacter robiniae]
MKTFVVTTVICICFLLFSKTSLAQTIKGSVADSAGKAVPYANAKLLSGNNLIVAFAATDNKGNYAIAVPADADKNKLRVEVSCVGFKKQSKAVTDFTATYNFRLSSAVNQLQTVTIKNKAPRLKVKGDTLNYNVSDFTSPQDRVIGDVIKKLPGVDVDANGKIKYNGKDISNLYIGGDNLLDDKYNIATSTIPNGVVDKVQIMENHQPIKMLKDKVVSDDVALNLTFKKDAQLQLVGQANAGIGVPKKYDGTIDAMMFKDKYKAINYVRGNNTGVDLQNDLIAHNNAATLSRLDNNKPDNLLSLGAAGNPNLPTSRYLFNQSGLLNLNNLVNLQKEVQLKTNISYLHDNQRQNYSKLTDIYQPGDTIHYTEIQSNKRQPDWVHAQFNLNINKSNYYLNNVLQSDFQHNAAYSDLSTNGNLLSQTLKNRKLDFSNEFNLMRIGKSNNILEAYSYINRISNPENRVLQPGINQDIFNQNQPYAQLLQTVNIPTWFTNNYLSFKHAGNVITQSYRAGFTLQSQNLTSDLSTIQLNGNNLPATSSSVNDLNWFKSKFFAEAGFDVPGDKLKLTVRLPLNVQQIHYSDSNYKLDESLTRLYFDPLATVRYQTATEQYISLLYNYKNLIGDINEAYHGDILTNYRTLNANNVLLSERKTQFATLGYNYRKAIKMFFWNINLSYTDIAASNISSTQVSNSFTRRIVLPYANHVDTWSLSGGISKYVYALHTTFSGGASRQITRLNQYQNGIMLPYNTITNTANVGTETKLSDQINISYKLYATQTSSKSTAVASGSSSFTQLQHQAAINYNPTSNLFLKLSGDDYFTSQTLQANLNYAFADFSARYRFTKSKVDLELNALNLLNTKTYSSANLQANLFTRSTYALPGRIVTAKVSFNF